MSDSESEISDDGSDVNEILYDGNSSSSDEEENDAPANAMPWFRVMPPEIEDGRQGFHQTSGPQNPPPNNSKPIAYYLMFFTMEFLQHIVTETNRYAQEFIQSRQRIRRFSRLHSWFRTGPTTISEMKGFISVILNMGLIRKPNISEYWNTRFPSQETHWFRCMFSRNRFQNLLKFFHIVNNNDMPNLQDPEYSPISKFKCFIDLFNRQSRNHYIPQQNLSIDESLISTKGRSSIIQYIPTKAAKFGVKLWVLAEAVTGYIVHVKVYKGKQYDPTPVGTSQGSYVVNTLIECAGLFRKGYHIITDSFFTSISLARELLEKDTFLTGTLRANRPMPPSIKKPVLDENQSIYVRQGPILLCAFKERRGRKPVRVLSTSCKAMEDNNKPKIITFYNKYMGGVDLADMMTESYTDGRKTMKVWKKVVFNIIQRMVINAYIIYKQNTSDVNKLSRLQFTQH